MKSIDKQVNGGNTLKNDACQLSTSVLDIYPRRVDWLTVDLTFRFVNFCNFFRGSTF